jgi:choline dehydrogenase-like flavoprotein
MFVDARSMPSGTVIETEVCIVGAGAAGITLGREFVNSGFRVALLESGDTDFNEATQDLYGGTNIGRRYFNPKGVGLRLRYFGGTTNHWGGWCALPDPLDFEAREGIKYSGWPFSRAYLEPWYRRAHDVLQLGAFDYAPSAWGVAPADIPPPFKGPHFVFQILQVSPPTRFGPDYGPLLRQAPRLTVYLNANALRFETGENNSQVQSLAVGVLPDHRLSVRARVYVLAAGGIENARLLLLSGKQGGNGLGNDHDLVGRFFMCHLEYPGGIIMQADPYMDFKFQSGDEPQPYNQAGVTRSFVPYICLSEDSRRKMGLPNLRLLLSKLMVGGIDRQGRILDDQGSTILEAGNIVPALLHKAQFETLPFAALSVYCSSEQMPNPDSRIGLGTATDPFGSRTVTVDWQLTADNKRGVNAGHRLLGAEIGRAGLGRFWSSMLGDFAPWPRRMFGNQHNIGTTRMNRDPAVGVVDENCRLHGIENLYVAGSSVFPTEGTANPTLTIVALALRLADHVKKQLA